MAENRTAKRGAQRSAKSAAAAAGFTAEERAAMRERVEELKVEAGGKRANKDDGERAVREKYAAMAPPDRALGERLHAIVKAGAPSLSPKTWYGMPAYANKDGQVVCFFRDAGKFKARYATLGFSDKARLDEGSMWPSAFALKDLGAAEEARIAALLKKAVG